MSFGGKYWPINTQDANLGPLTTGSDTCLGAFYAYGGGDNTGGATWIIGTTFLKNVYTVLRSQPTAIGFAELSNNLGLSSGESRSPTDLFYWETSPSRRSDWRRREWKQHWRWSSRQCRHWWWVPCSVLCQRGLC